MQPPVPSASNTAIFLDFDGTLVDFAPTPEAVVVSPELKSLLNKLNDAFAGAVALVTGRSLESLDGLVANPAICAAGCHGAEWRASEKVETVLGGSSSALETARRSLEPFADEQGLLLEHKPYSLAVHYRSAPELESALDDWLSERLGSVAELRVINGKFVREIQLTGVDKGVAVERFMKSPPFAGRTPVYLGDDVTDEDAFAYVKDAGGVAIKVGQGETVAPYRLDDFRAVYDWLSRLVS